MSRHSSTQVYNEFTKVPIKIHVAMSKKKKKKKKTRQFSKYLYCLILFLSKVLLCSRTRATDRQRTTGTTRLDNMLKIFLQLINSIGISLGTNREATPPFFIPNQCCISSRLFFTVTTSRSVLQYRISRSEYKW